MPYQTLFFLVLGLALIALLIAGAGLLAAWDPAPGRTSGCPVGQTMP